MKALLKTQKVGAPGLASSLSTTDLRWTEVGLKPVSAGSENVSAVASDAALDENVYS